MSFECRSTVAVNNQRYSQQWEYICSPASVLLLGRWWYLHTLLQPTMSVCIWQQDRPQKSVNTSFKGSLSNGGIRSGSHSSAPWVFAYSSLGNGGICSGLHSSAGITNWHGWQCWMWTSTIRSKPGNQTLVLRYSFVFVTPWCPSWASQTTLSQSDLGTNTQDPHTTNPPTTTSSVKTGSNWGPRACRSGAVKYPLAIALLSSVSSGSWFVSSSSSCHDTASGSAASTTALMSFSNNPSPSCHGLSVN